MTKRKQFYVYVIRDPRSDKNLQTIYVGKGNEGRIHTHWRLAENHYNSFLRRVFGKIRKAGLVPLIEIVRYFDNEADAFRYEMELIVEYGRRDLGNGSLCNLTNGGEGAAGCLATIENMRKLNANPEFKEATIMRNRELMRRQNADPEFIKAKGERARARHADPTFAKAWAEDASARIRVKNADPEFQKLCADGLRRNRADPEVAKAYAERMSALWTNPEFRKVNSEHLRKLHADPEVQARRLAGLRAYYDRLRLHKERRNDFDPI